MGDQSGLRNQGRTAARAPSLDDAQAGVARGRARLGLSSKSFLLAPFPQVATAALRSPYRISDGRNNCAELILRGDEADDLLLFGAGKDSIHKRRA